MKQLEECIMRSHRKHSTLVMAIGTPQLYLVTLCEEPTDVWDALKHHFERDTLANNMLLNSISERK